MADSFQELGLAIIGEINEHPVGYAMATGGLFTDALTGGRISIITLPTALATEGLIVFSRQVKRTIEIGIQRRKSN